VRNWPCEIELEKKGNSWRIAAKGWAALALVGVIACVVVLYFSHPYFSHP
jgi:hypothetical protein